MTDKDKKFAKSKPSVKQFLVEVKMHLTVSVEARKGHRTFLVAALANLKHDFDISGQHLEVVCEEVKSFKVLESRDDTILV